jgi:hypothetical protein
VNRRALLSAFLAAPVAVRLGRWVRPSPTSVGSSTEGYLAALAQVQKRAEAMGIVLFPYIGYGANDTWTPHA